MRRQVACLTSLICVVIATTPFIGSGFASAEGPKPGGTPGITSVAAILVSLPTGAPATDEARVLFARRIHAQRLPASLTKVVTALVAQDEYELDDVVEASPLVLQTHGSDLGLEPGMKITVRDLLYSLMLKSANDAGTALAAHHPLGYEHFIALMNQKARSLGARNTHLRNPHGLDQIGHMSSAYDMALFTRELLLDPALRAIVATKTHRFQLGGRARIFDHHHKMIGRYAGTIGVKTGFTEQAGHCLITAARTADGIAFTVVLGSQDHYSDTTALLDYGKALEVREASGGGGVEVGAVLPAPPTVPKEEGLATGALRILDPRDDARWLVLMFVLAGLTLATVGIRRRSHPLRDAADVLPWLERLVPPSERR